MFSRSIKTIVFWQVLMSRGVVFLTWSLLCFASLTLVMLELIMILSVFQNLHGTCRWCSVLVRYFLIWKKLKMIHSLLVKTRLFRLSGVFTWSFCTEMRYCVYTLICYLHPDISRFSYLLVTSSQLDLKCLFHSMFSLQSAISRNKKLMSFSNQFHQLCILLEIWYSQ